MRECRGSNERSQSGVRARFRMQVGSDVDFADRNAKQDAANSEHSDKSDYFADYEYHFEHGGHLVATPRQNWRNGAIGYQVFIGRYSRKYLLLGR